MVTTASTWNRKDLLDLSDITREEVETLFGLTRSFKEVIARPVKKVPTLRGKTVINLFLEPSTRTRTSFELAGKYLSADVINISGSTSSMTKGETLLDTVENLEAMKSDVIVIRHSSAGAPDLIAKQLKSSVINAGDGRRGHPTQGLLDLFTLTEALGDLKNKKIVILGDIAHSRVARSDLDVLKLYGAKVVFCGPPTLVPAGIEKMGAQLTYSVEEAVKDADAIIVLRLQRERMQAGLLPSLDEYSALYGLNKKRLGLARKNVVVMHPGPINRGVEISSAVADAGCSLILDQVTNGLALRMGLLYLMTGGHAAHDTH